MSGESTPLNGGPWWAGYVLDMLGNSKRLIKTCLFIIVIFPVLTTSALFLVAIGVLDSPSAQNRELLQNLTDAMSTHAYEQQTMMNKIVQTSLAQCVNPAIQSNNREGVNICMEESEYIQKRMIERELQRKSAKS